jgi:hypothetical protein
MPVTVPRESVMEKSEMRFDIIDVRYDSPYAGLQNIPGNNDNLMLATPIGKHWYDLEVYESTPLKEKNLKVVRVK